MNAGAAAAVSPLDYLVLGAYSAGLIALSVKLSRRVRKQDDYFLAGRSMSRWPIALSMYVALFSTNSMLGVTGWLNRKDGTLWVGLVNIGIMLAVPAVIKLYPSIFFRLRITTAYEYLEKRFNYTVRAFGALFFLMARLMWLSIMIYSAALVISRMLAPAHESGRTGTVEAILLLGALGTTFALSGGMKAVVWTDVVQFFVLFGGVLTAGAIAVVKAGGLGKVLTIAVQAGKFDPPPLFDLTSELTIVSALSFGIFGYLSSAGADQIVLQTYLTAKSDAEAKKSLLWNGMVLKPLSLVFPCLGLLLFAFYHQNPRHAALMRIPDDALPVFIVAVLPAGVRGLMIAAVMSAVLTSVASGLTALSACVQVDFVRRLRARPMPDAATVALARSLVLLWGIAITAGALLVRTLGEQSNILQILNILMYPFSGVLLGVFLLGLLTRRANSAGAMAGAALGFAVTIAAPLARRVADAAIGYGITLPPEVMAAVRGLNSISTFYYATLGTLSTVLFGYGVSLLFPGPPAAKLIGLSHRVRPVSGPTPRGSLPAMNPGPR